MEQLKASPAGHAALAPRLLADIGGTNARFAWQAAAGAPIEDQITLPCADYVSIEAAIRAYFERIDRPRPQSCAIAIANPVHGDRVQMTNHHWSFSISALRQALSALVLLHAPPAAPAAAADEAGASDGWVTDRKSVV